ncbi:hypothetical protein [Companilactobacillus ginsenosidimutans]|uniref:Uncharacterized protein n=1 Tax=Companilactobacillus ginsenosidimutans TaxID=1007676 RepID=A0A0H4QJP0_9LACO|nr:hypothetical protein [Companilactobacillus ginsenosidimutans]AKP68147.1 hypothetical protein ABM34_11785 [Companilactobacillus ginsenosidimutans]
MKKSGVLVCTVALTILLGLGMAPQNADADQLNNSSDTSEITGLKNDNNETTSEELNITNSMPTEVDEDNLNNSDRAGGQWATDPKTATPQSNFYYSVNSKWLDDNKKSTEDSSITDPSATKTDQDIAYEDAQKDVTEVASG